MRCLAALAPVAFLLLALACLGVMPADATASNPAEFGWRRPVNDYEQKFREARAMAEQILRQPVCRAQFEELPDWPPGQVPTEIIWDPQQSLRSNAFTMMHEGNIYVFVQTIRRASTEYLAKVLVHELAHVSSKSDYEPLAGLDSKEDSEEIGKIKDANEALVQRVTRVCMRAAGIA